MTTSDLLGLLPDRSVVLSLQELAEDIGSTDPARMPLDADEAQALVSALLAADAGSAAVPEIATMPKEQCLAAARGLLAYLAQDPDTTAQTRAVVSDPPADEQMSVETAVIGSVLLGALVAWLQTRWISGDDQLHPAGARGP